MILVRQYISKTARCSHFSKMIYSNNNICTSKNIIFAKTFKGMIFLHGFNG